VLVSGARNFVTGVKNRRQKPTPVYWRRFLEHVSWALHLTHRAITLPELHTCVHFILQVLYCKLASSVLTVGHQEEHPACKEMSDEVLAWLSACSDMQIISIWCS